MVRCSGRTPSSVDIARGAFVADADYRLPSAGQDDRGLLAVDGGGDPYVGEVHAGEPMNEATNLLAGAL